MNTVLTLSIIEMILRYGPTAVTIIADAIKQEGENITPEMIKSLFIDKEPEEYF